MRRLVLALVLLAGCTSSRRGDPPVPSPSASLRALRTPVELREVTSRTAGACSRPSPPPPGGLVATSGGSECLVLAPPSMTVVRVVQVEESYLPPAWSVVVKLGPDQREAFEDLTGRLEGKRLAFVAGGDVLTAPMIENAVPDGTFSLPVEDEAEALALVARLTG